MTSCGNIAYGYLFTVATRAVVLWCVGQPMMQSSVFHLKQYLSNNYNPVIIIITTITVIIIKLDRIFRKLCRLIIFIDVLIVQCRKFIVDQHFHFPLSVQYLQSQLSSDWFISQFVYFIIVTFMTSDSPGQSNSRYKNARGKLLNFTHDLLLYESKGYPRNSVISFHISIYYY